MGTFDRRFILDWALIFLISGGIWLFIVLFIEMIRGAIEIIKGEEDRW